MYNVDVHMLLLSVATQGRPITALIFDWRHFFIATTPTACMFFESVN